MDTHPLTTLILRPKNEHIANITCHGLPLCSNLWVSTFALNGPIPQGEQKTGNLFINNRYLVKTEETEDELCLSGWSASPQHH